jgi:hypothetical protein
LIFYVRLRSTARHAMRQDSCILLATSLAVLSFSCTATPVAATAGVRISANAQSAQQEQRSVDQARELVGNFLRQGVTGGWLSEEGRNKLGKIAGYGGPPGESNLVVMRVISGYTIENVILTEASAQVTVSYSQLGLLEEKYYKYAEDKKRVSREFVLDRDTAGKWRILRYDYVPAVDWKAAASFLDLVASSAHNSQYFHSLAQAVRDSAEKR